MELKNYQKSVMRNLSSYMDCINNTANLFAAWEEYWRRQDISVGYIQQLHQGCTACMYEGSYRRRQNIYGMLLSKTHL